MNPKDWIPVLARQWAAKQKRLMRGGDGKGHEDGWPTVSVLGRIKEEGAGAGQSRSSQHYPEVFTGDVLLLRRAMQGMPLPQLEVFWAHYLAREPVRVKADELGVSVASYWTLLDGAYLFIAGKFSALESLDKVSAA